MENKDAFHFFKLMSQNSNDPKSVKLANASDFSQMDADFIMKYANKESVILDLGSGTELIVNKIYNKVNAITAVEPFPEFTKFILPSENITVVNQTFADFEITHSDYDLVTIFGTMHYFNEKEATAIYKKFYDALKKGGKLIVKNQFGVKEDVVVEGYSEEQQCNYYAQYRHLDKEVKCLEDIGYQDLSVHDIYPASCNRWENTHFYAIVANKM